MCTYNIIHAASTVYYSEMKPFSIVSAAYEEQVVAFFRQPDITSIISSRYRRGVRPQLRDIIGGIRMEGTTALERIQMSGSIATYELAIVLR